MTDARGGCPGAKESVGTPPGGSRDRQREQQQQPREPARSGQISKVGSSFEGKGDAELSSSWDSVPVSCARRRRRARERYVRQ